MIGAQQVVDIAVDAAARLGGADETIVLVGDRVATSLRWANNSMTTNGVSTARNTTVISIVRHGDTARVGTLTSAEVDPSAIEELVAPSQAAAATAPEARDAAPLLSGNTAPADWDAPIPGTGPEVFSDLAEPLAPGFAGCANDSTPGAAVDATGLGQTARRVPGRPLRDDPATAGSRRHDDLP